MNSVIVILIAILNGYINAKAIKYNKIGRFWHEIQLAVLVVVFGVAIALGFIHWSEILLILSLYYIWFELSLNKFRGKKLSYVGYTSMTDKFIRKYTIYPEKELIIFKALIFIAGLAIYDLF